MAKKKTATGASGNLSDRLKARFEAGSHRHRGVSWDNVMSRLDATKLAKLAV